MFGSDLLAGAFAGFAATAPMTAVMEALYYALPRHQRYPLPPSEITRRLADKADVDHQIDQREHVALTLINHFAYGAATGAVYGAVGRRAPGAPLARGIGFGLIVWAASYLGLLPALGILRPATEHPTERNALMIVAHVVWGSVLGLLTERWRQR